MPTCPGLRSGRAPPGAPSSSVRAARTAEEKHCPCQAAPGCGASALLKRIGFSFSSRFPSHRPNRAPGSESGAPRPRLPPRTRCAPPPSQSASGGHVPGGQLQRAPARAPEPGGPGLGAARPPAQVSATVSATVWAREGQLSPGPPWDELSLGCSLARGEAVGPACTVQKPLLQVLRGSPQRNHPSKHITS